MATNKWLGTAGAVAQVNTLTPASVTIGNIFTVRVGGVLQVETATIVGTIDPGGAGNATITVTAAGMSNSPKAVSVAVANNDTASQVGGKVRTALGLDADVSAFFTISGSGAEVVLTTKSYAVNDPTMNIASTNGTCTGLTPQPTSADTTAGNVGQTISFTATAATVANVTEGIAAAIQATTIPEFLDFTAADNTTDVTLTSNNPGKPFTQTSSSATGAGSAGHSFVTTTTTTNSGPNDYAVTSNWSLNALPSASDSVLFDQSNVSVLWNLPAAFVAVTGFTRTGTYTGSIGLPDYDEQNGYYQYREKFLKMYASTMFLGTPNQSGPGREKYDFTNHVVALSVYSCGSPSDVGMPALYVKGNAATSTLASVLQGQIGVALAAGETAQLLTVVIGNDGNLASDVTLTLGSGVTMSGSTVNMYGGTLIAQSIALATVNCIGGNVQLQGSASVGTLINVTRKGTLDWYSNGTIASLFTDATLDNSLDQRTKTCTLCTVDKGFNIQDPGGKITFGSFVFRAGCSLDDGTLDVGDGRTLSIS